LFASTATRAQEADDERESLGASAHVDAPEPPREKVAGQREVIELRSTHGDSFSVIESVPSALPVFSGVPYLLIRGAPPSGTATLYDGAPIPAFHHLALGPAVAHLSLVSSVRFHAGVAPARYGRHIGGVHVLDAPDIAPAEGGAELELNAIDAHSETTAMIGDRMDTDVVAGMEAGLETFLVLTGSTALEDVQRYPFRPSHIVNSIADLIDLV
jgi:hypothetical protein